MQLVDTQLHGPRRIFARRHGCLVKLFYIAFVLFMIPVFTCGLSLVAYLVFPPDHIDILVMGLDSRPGDGQISRSDSIMLLGIDPSQLQVSLLSVPRDLYMNVPGYGLQPVNTVNMLGEMEQSGSGTVLLGATFLENFGIEPERYIRLDFNGFVELVDAVGGISIYVDRAIVDNAYPSADGGVISVRFDSGLQYMDGQRALIYARTRHADDDYRRAERQQQVLMALAGRLANPVHWPAVFQVMNQSLDTDLTLWDTIMLTPPVILNAGRFEQFVIDRDYIAGTADGHAVPNYPLIAPWLQARFD
jgi:LCP family protein required for cell wall assembly